MISETLEREEAAPREAAPAPRRKFDVDFSLALLNRTGAYYVCRELVDSCPELLAGTRYWRLWPTAEPSGILRKLLARTMLFELAHPGLTERVLGARGRRGAATLFLDPLYVLGARLGPEDIVLCHDVGPITHPDLYWPGTQESYRRAYERIRAAGPGMVFVSNASRDAFVALYGAGFRHLEVIPLFVRPVLTAREERPPAEVAKPFLLTVGALETRKNQLRSIAAFAASGAAERGYRYVICGPRGNAAEQVHALARQTPGVRVLGYVDDAELCWLYRHAAGFVLPSLLEGFGLPALEAAQHGLLPIIGTGGAQREAAGEGALLAEPECVAEIAAAMTRLIDMAQPERQMRIASIRRNAEMLSRERFVGRWRNLLMAA